MSLPLVVFEDFVAPLAEGDADGLKRNSNNQLIPSSTTSSVRHYKYLIKKGSVSDRLFHLQDLDPEPPEPRRSSVQVEQIGEANVAPRGQVRRRGCHNVCVRRRRAPRGQARGRE